MLVDRLADLLLCDHVLRDLRVFALIPMSFFILLLVVGLVYEWKKGALDWK